MTTLRRLASDSRGTSILEFAFIAPIIGFLIIGMVDLGRGFSAKFTLEQATHRALEKAAVGTTSSPVATSQTDYSFLITEASTASGQPTSNITLDQWLECDRVRQALYDSSCADTAEEARYVKLRIAASFKPTFTYGPLGKLYGQAAADGTVPIYAESTMRVE
jgi:Flp pilus assembly pilin Flp